MLIFMNQPRHLCDVKHGISFRLLKQFWCPLITFSLLPLQMDLFL